MKQLITLLMLCTMLYTHSQQTIQGTVINKVSFKQNDNIYTKNIIKDNNNNTVFINTYGGRVGLEAEVVSDAPQLYVGQEGTFYAEDDFLLSIESTINNVVADISINPLSITAGTEDILSITGNNFGDYGEISAVAFSNADFGGALYTDVIESDIINWTDDLIEVRVPDYAGTGIVRVTLDNDTDLFSDVLTVPYAAINIGYLGDNYPTQHVNINNEGGYTWQFNETVPEQARGAFVESLDTWRCSSNIPFVIGNDTDVMVSARDGVNVVTFADLGSSVLGRCTSRFAGCVQDGTVQWYVEELDIQFSNNVAWNYNNMPVNQFDFETVSVHELGHGHQLGHVIDNNAIMHFSVAGNTVKTNLSSNDISASAYIQTLNATSVCSFASFGSYNCSLSTGNYTIDDLILFADYRSNMLKLNTTYQNISIIDLKGGTTYNNTLNNLSNGLYFARILKDNSLYTKPFVIQR